MIPRKTHPDVQVLVLAAGKGVRMRSSLPKVLHPVLGRPMLEYVLHAVEDLTPQSIAVVIGHEGEKVRQYVGEPRGLTWVMQHEQLGTAHAVLQCEEACQGARDALIVCGDTPLLRSETLEAAIDRHRATEAAITVLTAELDDPHGYGRVVRDDSGRLVAIVEEKDADDQVRRIREVSSGIYCVRCDVLFKLLHKVDNNNAQGEYYLPDLIPLAIKHGYMVQAMVMADAHEMYGINDRAQLAEIERIMQERIVRDWQLQGVTIEQPHTVRIEPGVQIGVDTVIQAGCYLIGSTHIGDECRVGPYAVLVDAWLDDKVEVFAFSHIHTASISRGSKIGPFARLRPGTQLDEQVHIGNFVEVKKSVIGRGSKVNHLSYIGDATVGETCNIGAGTITCNYDGANKHPTHIGDNVFIGSDTKLIAPVTVGSNATIGAGSIITRDVKPGGLTLSARPDQRHLPHWQRPRKKSG